MYRAILSFIIGACSMGVVGLGGGFIFFKTGRQILGTAGLPEEDKAAYIMVGICFWMVVGLLCALAWLIGSGILDAI